MRGMMISDSRKQEQHELLMQIRELQTALYLLSQVTPDKTGGLYDDWLRFKEAIEVIRKRVEDARKAVTSPDS